MSKTRALDTPRGEVAIREFQSEDYEGVLHVYNTLWPEHATTLEEMRWDDETWDLGKYVFKRYVTVNDAGVVVGAGEYGHSRYSFHPQKFWVEVSVHPSWQRRGIGSFLYDHIWRELEGLEAQEVRAWAQEGRYEGARFLERRGFHEKRRTWESTLDLSQFDSSGLSSRHASSEGIEIATWAMERSTPSAARRLYELHIELMRDVPLLGEYTPPTYDEFEQWNLGSPGHIPEAYFIAEEGQEYIGECVLERQKGLEGGLRHGLTGVKKGYRRRGIASAMKVAALAWAKEAGYTTVRTWNDSANQSMLNINEKFGFEKEPSWITYVKEMGER